MRGRPCQKDACLAMRSSFKKEAKELKGENRRLQYTLATQVRTQAEGLVRQREADLADQSRDIERLTEELRRARGKGSHFYKSSQALQLEAGEHITKVGVLAEQLAGAKKEVKEWKKALTSESRRVEAMLRRQKQDVVVVDDARQAMFAAIAEAEHNREAAEAAEAEAVRGFEAATAEAAIAREEMAAEFAAAAAAEEARTEAEYGRMLVQRQAERSKAKASRIEERLKELLPTAERSADEWEGLSREAERKGAQRERDWLKALFKGHLFRPSDVAHTLADLNLIGPLFETKQFFTEYRERVEALMQHLQHVHFGESFGLYLHYEMRMTLPAILQATQAGCKRFGLSTLFRPQGTNLE